MTVDDALNEGAIVLGPLLSDARQDIRRLLCGIIGRDAAWLLAHGDVPVDSLSLARYRDALRRRSTGEPLAYILGEAGFYGRTFAVTRAVLVPRPESEQLVTLALEAFAPRRRALHLCDVGTGSGILAVTLALELPRASVLGIDTSAAALAVAAQNAAVHGVGERVAFRLGDALDDLGDVCFDGIVANLPYVRTADLAAPPDPTSHEPRTALDGGPDGLTAYRRLVRGMSKHLAERGVAFMEAGPDTADALAALAVEAFGGMTQARILRDYAGLRRIVALGRQGTMSGAPAVPSGNAGI